MGILGKIKYDVLFLMMPSWLLILFYLNFSHLFYNPQIAWALILFFQLFEITHEFSTLPRVLNIKSINFKNNLKYFIYGSILILLSIGFIHYIGFYYFFLFLIPLSIFHNIRQTQGILKWYFKKNNRYCNTSINIYTVNYILVCLLILSEGVENIPLNIIIPETISYYIFNLFFILNAFHLLFELYIFKRFQKIEWNRLLFLTHTTIITATLMLISKNYVWGYIFIIFDHCIHYLVIGTFSTNKINGYYKIQNHKIKLVVIMLCISSIGFILNLFDFKINYIYDYAHKVLNTDKDIKTMIFELKGNWKLSLLMGLSFIPSFLHYFYDLFIWKSSYDEAKIVYKD
jgi:hypothetical protein